MLALSLGLLAALGWGTHDLLVRRIAPGARVLPQLAVVMTVAALVVAPLGISRASAVPPVPVLLAILSGCVYFGASLALYAAFARAPVRLVAPVIGAYPLPALAFALMQGHKVSAAEWLAAALIVAGVAVVATQGAAEDKRPNRAALPLAFAACIGMATAFALGQEAAARIDPLLAASIARVGGAALALIVLARHSTGTKAALARWPILLGMGCLDGIALTSVIASGALPQASYAAVASSLFGVVTILLAWVLLGEKVRLAQGAGIALIFAGLAKLAAG
ncbi:MAG: DMT family transporter [Cypionkella sp.]